MAAIMLLISEKTIENEGNKNNEAAEASL